MIKERIKDFDICISVLEMIRDNIDDEYIELSADSLIGKLTELKEIFIESVTYCEEN